MEAANGVYYTDGVQVLLKVSLRKKKLLLLVLVYNFINDTGEIRLQTLLQ